MEAVMNKSPFLIIGWPHRSHSKVRSTSRNRAKGASHCPIWAGARACLSVFGAANRLPMMPMTLSLWRAARFMIGRTRANRTAPEDRSSHNHLAHIALFEKRGVAPGVDLCSRPAHQHGLRTAAKGDAFSSTPPIPNTMETLCVRSVHNLQSNLCPFGCDANIQAAEIQARDKGTRSWQGRSKALV